MSEHQTEQNLSVSSEWQTKEWRTSQPWYMKGKQNECEKYQLRLLQECIQQEISKSTIRLHLDKCELVDIRNPLVEPDGFFYTETFDGVWNIQDTTYYLNLKMVCGAGGAQTRSLREVFHFIQAQKQYISRHQDERIKFVNILDGDESFKYIYGTKASLSYGITEEYKKNVFIGDLYHFMEWYSKYNS